MKRAAIVAAIGVLVIGTAIVAYYGFGSVVEALGQAGWGGFLAIVAYHLVLTAGLGLACWAIVPAPRGPVGAYLVGRVVRDAGGEILPLSALGGFIIGILENVLGAYVIGTQLKFSVALIVIVVVLLLRPSGLFGRTVVTRV